MEPYVLYLNLFVIFNLSFIIVSLLFKKNRQKSNYFLAILILVILSTAVNNLILFYFQYSDFVFTQISFGGLNLVYGPVLVALVAFLHDKEVSRTWKWHLIPALIFFLYGLTYLYLPNETKVKYYHETLNGEHFIVNVLNMLMIVHALVYMFISKRELKRFKIEIVDSSFCVLQLKHQWANDFVNYQIGAVSLMLIAYCISIFVFSKSTNFCDMVVGPCVSLSIYSFIVFKNFQFNAVYERVSHPANPIIETFYQKKKEIKNNQHLQLELKERLELHLVQTKSFTNPTINLPKLAEELDSSPNLLSQTINQHFGVTFFELINNLRVEESKKLLQSEIHHHLKIDAIGEMAGFNSRSAFFSVFKKMTGITPTAYKNAVNVS